MRVLLFLYFLLILISCKSPELTAHSPEKYNMEILAEVIARNDLENIYPRANMAEGVEFFEEGTIQRPYSILFPDTPDKILIIWKDKERTKVHQIFLDGENRWQSNTGIRVGTTYDELVKLNGAPLKFYGFGWDHSGFVDWNNGVLANTKIKVYLAPQVAPPMDFYTDQVIHTTEDEIKAMDLKVRAILFQEPDTKKKKRS